MFFFPITFALGSESTAAPPTAVLYQMIHSGRCEDHGGVPVETTDECEVAAEYLYLRDQTVSTTSKTARPEGCYYTNMKAGRSLWFANQGTLGHACCSVGGVTRKPICKMTSVDLGQDAEETEDGRQFHMITDGKCEDYGWKSVVDTDDCELAAAFLHLRDQSASATSQTERPTGCYYTDFDHGQSLWFAADGTLGFTCCNEFGVSRKPICELPISRWELVEDTNIPEDGVSDDGIAGNGLGTDLVECLAWAGDDIREDPAKIGDCMSECEVNPECVAMVVHPWGTMLKKLSEPQEARAGFMTYLLTRIRWTKVEDTNIPDDGVSDDGIAGNGLQTDLVGCAAHDGLDIRQDPDAIKDCMTECENNPECVAIVAHPWGTMLKKESEPQEARNGFDTYLLERIGA